MELLHSLHGLREGGGGGGGGDYVSLTTMYVVICCVVMSCSVPVTFLFLLFQLLYSGTHHPKYGMTLPNFRSPTKPVWISMLCQAAWELQVHCTCIAGTQ